jgi:hypothetical protein
VLQTRRCNPFRNFGNETPFVWIPFTNGKLDDSRRIKRDDAPASSLFDTFLEPLNRETDGVFVQIWKAAVTFSFSILRQWPAGHLQGFAD